MGQDERPESSPAVERRVRVDRRATGGTPSVLESSYASLNALVLEDTPDAVFLQRVVDIAATLVPSCRCALTLDPEPTPAGPPREPVSNTLTRTVSPERVELLLVVADRCIGTLEFFPEPPRALAAPELAVAQGFVVQAAIAIAIRRRHSAAITLDHELEEAMRARACVDQAIGILMHSRGIDSSRAFELLRQRSQDTNRKVHVLAAELIHTVTGRPPIAPRPLAQRTPARPSVTWSGGTAPRP